MFLYTITKNSKVLYVVRGASSYMAGILLPVMLRFVCLQVRNILLVSSLLGAHCKGKHWVQQNKQQELMLPIDYGTQLMLLIDYGTQCC